MAAGKAERICGAVARQTQQPCRLAAGWGIPGVAAGPCKLHGGSLPSVRKAVERREAESELATELARFGVARSVDPVTAMLEMLAQIAGTNDLLTRLVNETSAEQVLTTDRGQVLFAKWVESQDRLLRAAHVAVGSKLIEAQTTLTKAMAERLIDFIEAVLTDLGYDIEAPEVGEVVRRRLPAVDREVLGRLELVAIEAPR
jgi:hypothetical protein